MSQTKKCFVLMPFKESFNNPWLFAVKPAAERHGLITFRADDDNRPMGKITRDITESIISADLIIAEMTGLSPNVTYELGLAHAAKKRVIMITQKTEEIPFDLHDIRHIAYDINQLKKLEYDLGMKIRVMLDTPEGGGHDFFPELKIMTKKEKSEIKRLKKENSELASLAYAVKVTTKPNFTYIFFNNRYIGISPQVIHVNPNHTENIITVFALSHFEEYRIISKKTLERKTIHIDLERRNPDLFPERVHKWLNYIRKQPNDVVIGHAIATYLYYIQENEEAVKQLQELLETCNNWSMLYNGIATSLSELGRNEEALDYYTKVKEVETSYISHFNLACTYSLLKKYGQCIAEIQEIIDCSQFIIQMSEINGDKNGFETDSDFDNIKNSTEYCDRFYELVNIYKDKALTMDTTKSY